MQSPEEEPQDERPVHSKKLTVKMTRDQWLYVYEKATRRRVAMSEVVRSALRREMRK